ncbi:MAG: transcriptional regulator [Gammaproteobacteria bacterium]|nr:transcriptional regulator [Gammaproteobacteria bacterium]
MKSQDIFILLKLVSLDQQSKEYLDSGMVQPAKGYVYDWEGWELDENFLAQGYEQLLSEAYSNRGLAASTGVSKSEVNASLKRSISVGMAKLDRKSGFPKANVGALLEFIAHGIKYVYPARPSAIVRGIPTSIAAPVLEGKLMTAGEYIYVWPDAIGKEKGQAVEPLYKTVPMAVKQDPRLYGFLALVDAIRLGGGRESAFAVEDLEKRLRE